MGSRHSMKLGISLFIITVVLSMKLGQFEALTIGSGRHLLQQQSTSQSRGELGDTARVDPLDNFHKYRGGFDIRNKHYWSSTVFSGIYGYAIAVIWALCGLGYGGFLVATTLCCRPKRGKSKHGPMCRNQCYIWPILLATIFTILAITATGLVLGGNAKFHSRAKTVVGIIIDTADDASDTIFNTTGAMKEMNSELQAANASANGATNFLTSTSQRLDSQAADIQRQARNNRQAIDKGLKIVYIITTITISLDLIAIIALTVFGILKFSRTLRWLIALCWILAVICWLFFGIYYFIENFAGDTCTALESFQQDPYNSSLSSILPCDELVSAQSALFDVSRGIYNIVNEVNRNLSTSFGNIVRICNSFSPPPRYEYIPDGCPTDSVRIGDIPQLLRMLTCTGPAGSTCNGGILISTNEFNRIEAYANSIQNLLDVYPGMESLVECQTVTSAFSEIIDRHCKPLKRYTRMTWAAMVFLSVVMVALVLIWTIEAHHERTYHSSDGSVKPHFPGGDTVEDGKVLASDAELRQSQVL